MTTIQSDPGTPTSFDVQVRSAAQRVRTSLVHALSELGIDPGKPQNMARQLKLDKSLAWKVSRVVTDSNPLAAIPRLPGRAGQRILVRALGASGAARDAVAAVEEAMEKFEALVDTHAGDRDTLEMMLSSLTPDGQIERDESHRRLAFQGNSAIFGVQARVQLTTFIIAPSEDPELLSTASLSGLFDFRRMRSNAHWAVARLMAYDDSGSVGDYGAWEPIDPEGMTPDGLPLMKAFSSSPLPGVAARKGTNGTIRFEITDGAVGNTGAVSCVTGWLLRRSAARYRTKTDIYGEPSALLSTPVELSVRDLFVHQSLGYAPPQVHVYSQLPGGPVYPADGRDTGIIPVAEQMVDLGDSPPDLTTPEIPRYPAMMEMAVKRMGFDLNEFHGFRIKQKYPPIPTLGVFRINLPERP